MESLRCPTCVALLPDPDARRCPLCRTKLRKRRRDRAVVLGESSRLSGRSLPSEVEFHVRSEERILPDEKRFDEIVHDPANLPHYPAPAAPRDPFAPAPLAPVTAKKSDPVDAVMTFAPTPVPEPEIDLTGPSEPAPVVVSQVLAREPVAREPLVPEPEVPQPVVPEAIVPQPVIDVTAEAEPIVDIAAVDEPTADESVSDSSDSRPKSSWQAVTPRGSSPLDGSLNEMVDELHRKAREDVWNHRSR